jgi:hypothetical protein
MNNHEKQADEYSDKAQELIELGENEKELCLKANAYNQSAIKFRQACQSYKSEIGRLKKLIEKST